MDIRTNQKVVEHCMGNMELQEQHPPRHRRPQKTEILGLINTRVSQHFNRGILRLPIRCQFLFKTSIHTFLYRPVRQRLLWLVAVSISQLCAQRNPNRTSNLLDADQLLLRRIQSSRLIPPLNTFDQPPTLRTVAGPDKTPRLFIEK